MDLITIGTAVGIGVVSHVTKKLLEKAADPENVAKSVNWVFSAADHFLKIRRGEKSSDAPLQPPPEVAPPTEPPTEADDLVVEDKTAAVEEIAKSLEHELESPPIDGVRLVEMDEFAMQQLTKDIESLIDQLEVYLGNLRHEEEKAAQFGGLKFAPPIVMNTIRIQHEEIAKLVQRLNRTMQRAYGVAAPDVDTLVAVTKSKS